MNRPDSKKIKPAVAKAFLDVHQGRSTDDVIVSDGLNQEFLRAASEILPGVGAAQFNWELLNLRKSGKLGPVTSVRNTLRDQEEYIHAVEIAARFMEDRYELTIDRLICDPKILPEFDRLASDIAPGYDLYAYRKAALKLRKAGKLKPELVKRIILSGDSVELVSASLLEDDPERMPRLPGIYIFADNSGALYIGESAYLRQRILKHLDHSDRKSLAHYFWTHGIKDVKVQWISFEKGSLGAATKQRRALEASLIDSRKPRFNVQHSICRA